MKTTNQLEKFCLVCSKAFLGHHNKKICSDKCAKDRGRDKQVEISHGKFGESNQDSWVECPVCEFRSPQISGQHVQSHGYSSMKEFRAAFPSFFPNSKKTTETQSARISGNKNPAFGHDGKFSPFSTNFVKYHGMPKDEVLRKIEDLKTDSTNNMNLRGNNNTRKEYYTIRGFTEEEAATALYNRQNTFTIEKLVEEHGFEKGMTIWNERQEKWQANLNSKPDEERLSINRKKQWKGGSSSKEEKELIDRLSIETGVCITKQFPIKRKDIPSRSYFFDLQYGNKIIEYNGDFWHANPKIYSPESIPPVPRNKLTAKEIWEKEEHKLNTARELGYEVMVVWESDYKNNKTKVIQECKDFLTA